MTERNRTASTWRRPSTTALGLAAVGLLAADWGSLLAGNSIVPGGPLDEAAHLLTTLLVLWALDPAARERFMVPALVASVAIDADHVPGELGATALAWRRRRVLLLGVALGLALHLWRDMSEAGNGVALLWPLSYRPVRLTHTGYLAVMALVVTGGAYRLRAAQR